MAWLANASHSCRVKLQIAPAVLLGEKRRMPCTAIRGIQMLPEWMYAHGPFGEGTLQNCAISAHQI